MSTDNEFSVALADAYGWAAAGDVGNVIDGGAGNNWIRAGSGGDIVHGGGDSNNIVDLAGNDALFGDDGDHQTWGADLNVAGYIESMPGDQHGSDVLVGGLGKDEVHASHRRWRHKRRPLRNVAAAMAAFTILVSGASGKGMSSGVCTELSRLLAAPVQYQLRSPAHFLERPCLPSTASSTPGKLDEDKCVEATSGPSVIPNVDLDGDGLLDEMRFDCPGAGSSQPGDPCEAEIRFGGGPRLRLPESVLLVLHRGTYYAIKGDVYAGRPRGGGTAYRITRSGLQPVCTNL